MPSLMAIAIVTEDSKVHDRVRYRLVTPQVLFHWYPFNLTVPAILPSGFFNAPFKVEVRGYSSDTVKSDHGESRNSFWPCENDTSYIANESKYPRASIADVHVQS